MPFPVPILSVTPPLRFGLLVDGPELLAWQASCLRGLLRVPEVELRVVLFVPRAETAAAEGRAGVVFRAYWNAVTRRRSRALQPVALASVLGGRSVPIVTLAQGSGLARPSRGTFEPVAAPHDLDFALSFASATAGSDLAASLRYGVWQLHLAEAGQSHGPPCFWSFIRGGMTDGALHRLTGRLDERVVLRSGSFPVHESYEQTLDALLFGVGDWCADVCRHALAAGAEVLDGGASTAISSSGAWPDDRQSLSFLRAVVSRSVIARTKSLVRPFFRTDQWNVGIMDAPIEALLAGSVPRVRWLPDPPPDRFRADPFAVVEDGRITVLFEDYDYGSARGSIAAVQLGDGGSLAETRVALDLPTHAAYPFLLRHEGEIYCIPETHERREVALFRAASFPTSWEKVAVLLTDIAAVDPTVVHHEGYWWLFCTDQDIDPQGTLFVWFATELKGPWRPHAANPVKVDASSSRPAGTPFIRDRQLYRPAQDCSRTYGGGIALNRVLLLTPTQFQEEIVTVLRPPPSSRYGAGMHTIAAAGERTLVDGKRRVFLPSATLAAGLRGVLHRKARR